MGSRIILIVKDGFDMKYKKIYMVASYQYQSGGTESSHQLVGWLNDRGNDAYIYYYDLKETKDIPIKYQRYSIKISTKIEDKDCNLMIVPETLTNILYQYKTIQKGIWWLSLNYYLYQIPNIHSELVREKYELPVWSEKCIKVLFRKSNEKIFEFGEEKYAFLHFYNCEYVKMYLEKNGVSINNMFYLCGPIRDEYYERGAAVDINNKEDIILYNPNKGLHFTKKILKYANNINTKYKFIPLINMNPEKIVSIMEKSKLYIDFGDFPGPERIPREAVMMYCNILVAKIGSSYNMVDVPIPEKYKYYRKKRNISNIYSMIVELMDHYMEHIDEFEIYRSKVKSQRTDMKQTLDIVFGESS